MLVHAAYDALLTIPELAGYAMLSTTAYILLSYRFFHSLRTYRSNRRETVSLTATFLFGVSLIFSATFVYLSTRLGMAGAANVMGPGALNLALILYMFLREIPETLT